VELLKCDKVTMYVVDNKKKEIRSRPKSDLDRIIVLPISSGLVGEAVLSGNVVNVEDAYKHSKFNREMDLRSGYHTKSVLCVPINNSEKQTIAVMQAINKFN
jgi:signal transduction protein with GAF and PtsI domain